MTDKHQSIGGEGLTDKCTGSKHQKSILSYVYSHPFITQPKTHPENTTKIMTCNQDSAEDSHKPEKSIKIPSCDQNPNGKPTKISKEINEPILESNHTVTNQLSDYTMPLNSPAQHYPSTPKTSPKISKPERSKPLNAPSASPLDLGPIFISIGQSTDMHTLPKSNPSSCSMRQSLITTFFSSAKSRPYPPSNSSLSTNDTHITVSIHTHASASQTITSPLRQAGTESPPGHTRTQPRLPSQKKITDFLALPSPTITHPPPLFPTPNSNRPKIPRQKKYKWNYYLLHYSPSPPNIDEDIRPHLISQIPPSSMALGDSL
jgi:hypothetical protein